MSRPDPSDRFIYLGQPGYGEQTAGAARAFWRATRLADAQVYREYREGSLLAANFNGLWCGALNLARSGRRVTHFAMIHADVEPADWWLDTLIDEMEARDLDILGAVVPIKDTHGLTSLALDRPDGDTWRPLCRLTMSEVYRLPETFTSEDVGHPLLLNTGLWVCRFDPEWCRKVHFTINDRIVVDPDGQYRPQCEPEDWFFSRLCHELKLKVGATRKVPLMHRGVMSFTNGRAWGDYPHDAGWIDSSPLPTGHRPGHFILPDIPGWLTYDEGAALAELARGKYVLEVGSFYGLSTVCMARTAESVTSFDPHDGRGTAEARDTLPAFRANLERYGVADRVGVHVGTLDDAPGHYALTFDLVFIDGSHDRESVDRDIVHALPLLAPGGLLAFHDYGSPVDPDVTAAVDALVGRGGEILSVTGSLAVVSPPALVPEPLEV